MSLTEKQFPFVKAYYGPGDPRGVSKGPTAKALKRAMGRLGYLPWTRFDDIYNHNLQDAMADWQRNVGISPPHGQYGRGSWEKLRAQKVLKGEHKGEYALDYPACKLVRDEAAALVPPVQFIYPYPVGEGGGICQGLHATAGLLGNWAIDFCDKPGSRVLAVEAGTIQKLSGHSPSDDTWDAMGVFGWSTYLRTARGYVYFYTHLGWRTPSLTVGTKVPMGAVLGKIGDQHFRPDHLHVGVTSPLGQVDARKRITAVSQAARLAV